MAEVQAQPAEHRVRPASAAPNWKNSVVAGRWRRRAALIAARASGVMFLASGDCVHSPPSCDLARARPRAPKPLTNSSSLSASVRDSAPAFCGRHAQRLDDAALRSSALFEQRHAAAVVRPQDLGHVGAAAGRSAGRACRRRTCPSPRRSCMRAKRRRDARRRAHPSRCVAIRPSIDRCRRLSSSTNDISTSICVNSGWRSRRRSSSRKQRTIWK